MVYMYCRHQAVKPFGQFEATPFLQTIQFSLGTPYIYFKFLIRDINSRYLITCGSDGDVRIYDGFDDDDPESFRAGEDVTAVTFQV